MKKEKTFNIFIDGASKNNPGPAGIGVVILDETGKCLKKIYKYIGKASNNAAEYTALLFALEEALILKLKDISIKSDSQLLVRQLNGEYKVKSDNIKPLYLLARHMIAVFDKIEIVYIERQKNKEADRLASLAVREDYKAY